MSEDGYASNYMKPDGRLLLRDKIVGRSLLLILGMATFLCGAGAVATFLGVLPKSSLGVALFLTAMTTLMAFLAVSTSVVRSVVSSEEVRVQYGLWGPRVPVARIRRCRVVPYDWQKFGGWGIKRAFDGTWAYVMSPRGDVVELSWTDDAGKERTVLFSAADPRAVVAAVDKARSGAGRVRVAGDDDVETKAPEEIEAALEPAADDDVSRRSASRRGAQGDGG